MDNDDKYYTQAAMKRFGSSFVAALADALARADSRNTRRIINAFPDLIEEYGPGSPFFAATSAMGAQA